LAKIANMTAVSDTAHPAPGYYYYYCCSIIWSNIAIASSNCHTVSCPMSHGMTCSSRANITQ
jgi:hypothetical protein